MPTTEAPPVVERSEGCTLFFSGGGEVIDAGGGSVPNALLIGPPFTITEAEMDAVVAVVGEAISAVCGD